ncbi:12253_t:CDS:2, partial [Acaulospora morrowiae]
RQIRASLTIHIRTSSPGHSELQPHLHQRLDCAREEIILPVGMIVGKGACNLRSIEDTFTKIHVDKDSSTILIRASNRWHSEQNPPLNQRLDNARKVKLLLLSLQKYFKNKQEQNEVKRNENKLERDKPGKDATKGYKDGFAIVDTCLSWKSSQLPLFIGKSGSNTYTDPTDYNKYPCYDSKSLGQPTWIK